jgi:hypothetical protein
VRRRYDRYVGAGALLCAFQLYRALLLPFVNTWMLWSLLGKLALPISNAFWFAQAALLAACLALSIPLRALLHVPVQLFAVCFSASTASRLCPAPASWAAAGACAGGVLALQLALSVAAPALIAASVQASPVRSFVPHVQVKRSLFVA